MESHKKGQTVRCEARNLVKKITNKCDEEARRGQLFYPLHQADNRISEYTGLSIRTITRIRGESLDSGEEVVRSPEKKRPRSVEKKFQCSEEDKMIIRDIIHEFYTEKKIVPSGSKLIAAIRERIEFPWKRYTLYALLKSMGFQWKRRSNGRKILMEKPNIVAWRVKYLKALQYHRGEGRNIVYIGETWVDNNLRFEKDWQIMEILGVQQNSSSSQQLTIVHAGGKNGFVRNAVAVFKAKSTSGDCHGQLDSVNFEKWINEKLLPNIPPNTVVIMDNSPCHSVQVNKIPSKYAKKSEMFDWLVKNNIPYANSMRKYELMQLINQHRPSQKVYKIDQLLRSQGFHVLRLPPYMCELNPIELAWAEIKRKIGTNNNGTLSLNKLETLTKQTINEVSQSAWEQFCIHVEEVEKKYLEKDYLLENTIDIVSLNGGATDTDYSTSSEDL